MQMLKTAVVCFGVLATPSVSAMAQAIEATLYKNPQCNCCENYANILNANGYSVKVVPTNDLPLINRQNGVPSELEGCHTLMVGGYVVEGHVPLDILKRLLTERPQIKGISLPGMPMGSPGMFGTKTEPFVVYEISDGPAKIYATE